MLPEIYGFLDGKRLRCLTGLDYFTYRKGSSV